MKKYDNYDYTKRVAYKNSPDGKHEAKFTNIGEWKMGLEWFNLIIDEHNFGHHYVDTFDWTSDSRYFVISRLDPSEILVVDAEKKLKAVVIHPEYKSFIPLHSIVGNILQFTVYKWDGKDKRWTEPFFVDISKIEAWESYE